MGMYVEMGVICSRVCKMGSVTNVYSEVRDGEKVGQKASCVLIIIRSDLYHNLNSTNA